MSSIASMIYLLYVTGGFSRNWCWDSSVSSIASTDNLPLIIGIGVGILSSMLQEDSAYRQFTTDYRNWCWYSSVSSIGIIDLLNVIMEDSAYRQFH